MKNPFFTVIIPTFNRAALLKEAIQSALDQTFGDFELIVVDDHSTDNTKDTVRSFKDDRIMYIVNDRTKGAAGARNAGIFRAKGEWIAFLDSDDVWLPQKLEVQAKMIQEMDKAVGFICAGYATYDFEKRKEIAVHFPEKEGWVQRELLYSNYAALSSVAVQKDILLKVVGFDEQFPAIEDWELWIRISGIAKLGILKEKLIYLRQTNKDRLSSDFHRTLTAILLFRQKHNNLLRKSLRLRNRIATTILTWSLEINDWSTAFKALPWTFAGMVINPYLFLKTMNGAILKLCK